MKSNTTLAVYANSIGFGYAVVRSPREPIDCGVVKIVPVDNTKCLNRIAKLIDKFSPYQIVVNKPNDRNSGNTKRVRSLLKQVERMAINRRVHVHQYSRETIRFVFSEFDKEVCSKYQIAHLIGTYFPQFEHRLPKPRKPWMAEDYNMGLFDALSLVVCHFYMTD